MLKRKFIAMSTYIKNTERSQINDLMLHLKLPEKQEQVEPKIGRKREIIKIRVKIKQKSNQKSMQGFIETKFGSSKI
jgi:hypothetical protein